MKQSLRQKKLNYFDNSNHMISHARKRTRRTQKILYEKTTKTIFRVT